MSSIKRAKFVYSMLFLRKFSDEIGSDIIIFKTPFNNLTNDIDVFIDTEDRTFKNFLRRFQIYGAIVSEEDLGKYHVDIKGGLRIEVHFKITWFGLEAINRGFIKENSMEKFIIINNKPLKFKILSTTAEKVINFSHWILDLGGKLTIRDMAELISAINDQKILAIIIQQALKNKWLFEAYVGLKFLSSLHEVIIGNKNYILIKILNILSKYYGASVGKYFITSYNGIGRVLIKSPSIICYKNGLYELALIVRRLIRSTMNSRQKIAILLKCVRRLLFTYLHFLIKA